MGKKRAGGRRMREEEDEFEDEGSVASMETRTTHASDLGDFYDSFERSGEDEQALDEAVDELTEKRMTTRVEAMDKVLAHLMQFLPPEDVSESLVSNTLSCLRRPSEGEATRGARILSILSLILGADEERFFQRTKNVLEPIVKTSRSAEAKVASIRALALACFVSSGEEENTDEVMAMFEKFFNVKIVGSICSAALESWGLLASSLDDEALAGDDVADRMLPHLMSLLDHSDVDVRSAAGENIALLYEAAQRVSVALPFDEELVQRFQAMSKDSSKKNSKKDRKTQRTVFRDIHATLANGESPHISFSVKNESIDIRSWGSVRQFEAIKGCIQGGLQNHLKYNNVLRGILDLPETFEERVIERRDVFDKKSSSRKQRSNELKGDRRRKQNIQDAFLDEY